MFVRRSVAVVAEVQLKLYSCSGSGMEMTMTAVVNLFNWLDFSDAFAWLDHYDDDHYERSDIYL